MSWTAKLKAHSASKQPKPRKPRAARYTTLAQTRSPNEETGDPGEVMAVHYTFDGSTVTLIDAKGIPIGGENSSYVLQPGQTAVRIATRLALAGRVRTNYAPQDAAWVV
ncbi:hypothetical protein GPL17_16645 [Bradyrhizobium yuanmingense]|uniref:hypothetical protein n=1 Tax=Bradyrhizobium yuanmingense TaxID=108015 RepID=UPI0012F8BFB2|nr:hypothetical protein [Bradyrhizobium yuanmingense]MVT52113.1 hypothetical protein [Bradyrhizobium yuanmingense]